MNTYWNNNGKYQLRLDEISDLMPSFEYTDSKYMNLFIIASKLYHDVYNNGGCNIEDCYVDDFYERVSPYVKSNLNSIQNDKEYLENFMDKVIEFLSDKDLLYTKYVVYQNYDEKKLSKNPMAGFTELSSGIKEYLDSWIKTRTSEGWNFTFI